MTEGFYKGATKEEAIKLEAECHQWMIDHVPGYNAIRWAEIELGGEGLFGFRITGEVIETLEKGEQEKMQSEQDFKYPGGAF